MKGKLTEESLIQIYQEKIKPKFFDNVSVADNKTAVFLGGQPGAGKSYLKGLSIENMTTKSAVVIDSDLLRQHHPYHAMIAEKDIYNLDKECYRWGTMLIGDAVKENKNLVFDGTLGGNLEQTLKTIAELKAREYKVNVSVLATNDVVSKIGVTWRYEQQKAQWGKGRDVEIGYHDQIYQRLPDNLHEIIKSNYVDELKIFGRNNLTKEIFSTPDYTYNLDRLQKNPSAAIYEFIQERTRPLKAGELYQLQAWATNTVAMIQSRSGDVNMFKYALTTTDINAKDILKSQIKSIAEFTNKSLNQTTMANKVTQDDSTKKTENLKGRLGSEIEFNDVKLKGSTDIKKVATFSLADNSKGKDPVWHNVQIWEDKFPKNIKEIKKGDLIELKGYNKTFETKAGEGKTKTEFVATDVVSHQAKSAKAAKAAKAENVKERHTLKGNLGQDPVITKVGDDKTVAAFSIAVKKDGSDQPHWQQVQVWNDGIEKNKISELKKGDFVELKGYYGKEYQNKNQETKQDFVLEESKLLKHAQEKELAPKKSSGMKM